MPNKTVSVQANITDQSYEVSLKTRHFTLKIDQPEPSGRDSAPTPLDFFLFSLGACTCTVGKIIAEQKKIDLKSIDVKIDGEINTDFLLGKTKEGRAGFYNIKVHTQIDAPMSKEEKEEFLKEIDKRCPLSDNIQEISSVSFVLVEK